VDPVGDIWDVRRISCFVKPGGLLYLGVPIGPDQVPHPLTHLRILRFVSVLRSARRDEGMVQTAASKGEAYHGSRCRLHYCCLQALRSLRMQYASWVFSTEWCKFDIQCSLPQIQVWCSRPRERIRSRHPPQSSGSRLEIINPKLVQVVWNAHRIYGPWRLPLLTAG